MNRKELVAAVCDRSGQPRQAVEDVLGVLGPVVAEALTTGDKLTLPGLLTATRVERAERQGRNPQTGEAITIAPSSGVKLTAAPALKTQIKGR